MILAEIDGICMNLLSHIWDDMWIIVWFVYYVLVSML